MSIRVWGTSLLMFLSTVTAVGQTANRYLKAPLPNDWEESGEVFQQILPVDDHWWKSFQDAKLDSLIALAVDRNYSVAMAINRIAAARANLWIERSNFLPSIGLNAGWTRQETSGNTSSLPQTTDHYYDASLSMSWELDIFGSIRKRVKAQKENFAASKEEYTGVMVSLAAEVASAYINLRELQQELEVVKKNSASQEEVLKITEVRYNTGLVAKLDVAQAKSVLYNTKASIPQLEAGINQYITTLAVLLGMYPQDIRPVLESGGTLPDYRLAQVLLALLVGRDHRLQLSPDQGSRCRLKGKHRWFISFFPIPHHFPQQLLMSSVKAVKLTDRDRSRLFYLKFSGSGKILHLTLLPERSYVVSIVSSPADRHRDR